MQTIVKVYKVNGGDSGDDYGALSFEKKYPHKTVGEICEELLGENESYEDSDGGFGIYRQAPITEMESSVFMRMRNYMDYDDLKHEKLYLDFEVIK